MVIINNNIFIDSDNDADDMVWMKDESINSPHTQVISAYYPVIIDSFIHTYSINKINFVDINISRLMILFSKEFF